MMGTAPIAGAQCGVDWINQQTCDNIVRLQPRTTADDRLHDF